LNQSNARRNSPPVSPTRLLALLAMHPLAGLKQQLVMVLPRRGPVTCVNG
jgi:hypothetical protein